MKLLLHCFIWLIKKDILGVHVNLNNDAAFLYILEFSLKNLVNSIAMLRL